MIIVSFTFCVNFLHQKSGGTYLFLENPTPTLLEYYMVVAYYLHNMYSNKRDWDGWAHKRDLTLLSLAAVQDHMECFIYS